VVGPMHAGQTVQMTYGTFRGRNAVLERYLSGTDRVALSFNEARGANVRVILPSNQIAPCGWWIGRIAERAGIVLLALPGYFN
jgi:hypothetical protein